MKASLVKRLLAGLVVLIVLSGCGVLSGVPFTLPKLSPPAQPTPVVQEARVEPPAGSSAPVQTTTLEQAYIDIYSRVNPSVVNIRVVEGGPAQGNFNIPGFPELPNQEGIPAQAEGSGFIYDQNGHIVTNNHVIEGAKRIVVTFSDGSEAAAEPVGADPSSDLAVIKVNVDASLLVPVSLGDSDQLKVGQVVVAIGNPFGLQNSMTTGIVSGLGRMLPTGAAAPSGGRYSIPDMIQTDAAINPGNSGGPLLNLNGEVVGVNTAIASNVGINSGVGYAVPAAIVKQVVPQLIAEQKVEYPWLGISGSTLNADVAKAMNLDASQRGVLVATVIANGPAERAGLKGSEKETTIDGLPAQIGGDVITAIDGQTVRVFDDLLGYIVRHTRVGDTVTLDIVRDGKPMQVPVTLEARPAES